MLFNDFKLSTANPKLTFDRSADTTSTLIVYAILEWYIQFIQLPFLGKYKAGQ